MTQNSNHSNQNPHSTNSTTSLGIDMGTSGIRACIVDSNQQVLFETEAPLPLSAVSGQDSIQTPFDWQQAMDKIMGSIPRELLHSIEHIIGCATSSTVYLANSAGKVLTHALMYDDTSSEQAAKLIEQAFQQSQPKQGSQAKQHFSGALGASSTLAKVCQLHSLLTTEVGSGAEDELVICHQIDWLTYYMTGQQNITDENNALKLGYDSVNQQWPNWVQAICPVALPKVVKPGSVIPRAALPCFLSRLSDSVQYHAGTTDSIAAFLSTGAHKAGDAMTSLGSSMAIKMIAEKPIFDAEKGIYSHYLQGKWLIGGASNAGGLALLKHFSLEDIKALSQLPALKESTQTHFIPLVKTGERFPQYNPNLQPFYEPWSDDSQVNFSRILAALVRTEIECYQELTKQSKTKLTQVFTTGGGLKNLAWQQLRAEVLPLHRHKKTAPNTINATGAAFGVLNLI